MSEDNGSTLKKMYRSFGTYFWEPIVLACDGNCGKAWGGSNRPRLYRTVNGTYEQVEDSFDESVVPDGDDFCYLADDELGEAPADPGTYEGIPWEGKPAFAQDDKHNKWCARACERCEMESSLEDVELHDFTKRLYNIEPHVRD